MVHHTPGRYSRDGLEKISGTCQGYALECKLWEEEFDPNTHYELHLKMLKDFIEDAYDWIIIADSDEFQQWPSGLIRNTLDRAFQLNTSYIMGMQVDRVAADGKTNEVIPLTRGSRDTPSIFRQFPLTCRALGHHVKKEKGPPYGVKVVAFRNYLRAQRDRRRIITPDDAKLYLSECIPQKPCPRASLNGRDSVRNVANSTYYGLQEDRYRYLGTPFKARVTGLGLWRAVEYKEDKVLIHHFRWHAGSVTRKRERLERYRGNCPVDGPWGAMGEPKCTPLVPNWIESVRAHKAVKVTGRVNLTGTRCEMPSAEEDVETDTSYQGLAWEEFESSLLVVSKVRNKVKGDSQTRMAFLKQNADEE